MTLSQSVNEVSIGTSCHGSMIFDLLVIRMSFCFAESQHTQKVILTSRHHSSAGITSCTGSVRTLMCVSLGNTAQMRKMEPGAKRASHATQASSLDKTNSLLAPHRLLAVPGPSCVCCRKVQSEWYGIPQCVPGMRPRQVAMRVYELHDREFIHAMGFGWMLS